MHPFHDFLLQCHRAGRVLDLGAGEGDFVRAALARGIDAWGVDAYAGGYREWNRGDERILPTDGVRLPFGDGAFDTVVSNQVLEHVEDLDGTLGEVRRVLAADGITVHVFPAKEVIVEVHLGLPLVHRMPPGRERYLYALAMRRLGLGYFKGSEGAKRGGRPYRSAPDWTRDRLVVLDDAVRYRTANEVVASFSRHFDEVRRLDAALMASRLPGWLPDVVLAQVALRASSIAVAAGSARALRALTF